MRKLLLVGIVMFAGACDCRSSNDEPRPRTTQERVADEARAEREVMSMGRFLESATTTCPEVGRCFLSKAERRFAVKSAALTLRAKTSIWSSLALQAFRHGELAKTEDISRAIDGLFFPSPQTEEFWSRTTAKAERAMKRELAAHGARKFLSPAGTMGPPVPVQMIMAEAIELDDAQLLVFAAEWKRRDVPFYQAAIAGDSGDKLLNQRAPAELNPKDR